jgi:hypothetical protein
LLFYKRLSDVYEDELGNRLIGIGWEYLPPDEVRDFRSLEDFGSLNQAPTGDWAN